MNPGDAATFPSGRWLETASAQTRKLEPRSIAYTVPGLDDTDAKHVDGEREMVDETAERIATLGASPTGTAGALVAQRSWEDYELGRADAIEHMAALDVTHAHVMQSHRQAIEQTEETEPVTC